jgi:hypothetical protein
MTIPEIAQLLENLGCPPEKSADMASQLDKRARMDAERKRISHEAAFDGARMGRAGGENKFATSP